MAADLVGRALVPHRFVEVVPGVTMVIGSRQGEGEITDFFADDRRDPESRRTYSARSAVIARDEQGYVMQMRDGAVQYMTADLRMSEIRFERYDLAVDLLTQQATLNENATSLVLVQRALETGWTDQIIAELAQRSAEGLRVIGMCLLILAVAGFPSGQRRGSRLPIEFVVLIIAFSDRGFSTYASSFLGPMRPAGGALGMILVGTLIIMFRMWGHLLTAPTRLLRRQPA
jgi:lipopolysaccharide export system permease protein